MLRSVFIALVLLVLAGPVFAQDSDLEQRTALAKKMHEIRPARTQVEEAVKQVMQNLPPEEQARMQNLADTAFDYQKLEDLSTQTMVDLFTVAELQRMVDYFGSEEAKAISKKLPQYQAKLQPEVIRMLDAALMVQKTSGPADKVLPDQPTPEVSVPPESADKPAP